MCTSLQPRRGSSSTHPVSRPLAVSPGAAEQGCVSGWCPAGPGQGRRRWRARRARRFCRSGCCCLCCPSSRGRLLAPLCTTRRAAEEAARGPAGGRGAPSPGAALKTHPAQSHPGPDSSAVPTSPHHSYKVLVWTCLQPSLLIFFLGHCMILFFPDTHTVLSQARRAFSANTAFGEQCPVLHPLLHTRPSCAPIPGIPLHPHPTWPQTTALVSPLS